MASSHKRAVTSLKAWVKGLNPEYPEDLETTPHRDLLAIKFKVKLLDCLNDVQVAAAVEEAALRSRPGPSADEFLKVMQEFLLDTCWISHSNRRQTHKPSRSQKERDIVDVAKQARKLAKNLDSIEQLVGQGLTTRYMESRFMAGNPGGHNLKRKGWVSAVVGSKAELMTNALLMLASELDDEAALLRTSIVDTRQVTGSRKHANALIDMLLPKSLCFGLVDISGNPVPDFSLVQAVVTHLDTNHMLTITALQRRWNVRQGKLNPKVV